MVRFYVNGKLSGLGDNEWKKSIPQIGSEFHISIDKDGKIVNGREHIMIVDKVTYNPLINQYNTIKYELTDVNIYLVDKAKKSEESNID